MPVFITLMDRKLGEGYLSAFQAMREACPGWRPKGFTCDYEKGMVDGFCEAFKDKRGNPPQFQGCAWHLLKNCYSKMVDLQLPERLRWVVLGQVKATQMAATEPEHSSCFSKLKSLLGLGVSPKELRASMCTRAVLSAVIGEDDDLCALSKFGVYFKRTWIDGTGGAPPQAWCMAFRDVALHGVIKTCNMIAENGNRKINQAKKECNPNVDHVSFIQWLLLWMVEACIAPVILVNAGW
jgi:hypothetical protein